MRAASRQCIGVDGELTIYTAHALREQLLAALAQGDVEVDLGAVSEVDGAGIQLLMAAKHEARVLGRRLILTGHAPAVVEAVELAGLGAWFGDALLVQEGAH